MKGIIKKALVAAAVLPCMLLTTACGNSELSTKQKEESYNTLRDLSISRKFIDAGSEAGSYVMDSETKLTYDFSKSGLTDSQIEDVSEDNYMQNYNSTDKVEIKYGYKADGTGYRTEKEYNKETQALELEEQEFAKKTGEDYIAYNLNKLHVGGIVRDVKIAKRVDDKYGKEFYSQELTEDVSSDLIDVFDALKKNTTLKGFEKGLVEELKENIDVGDNLETKFNVKKSGKDYVLTAKIYVDDYSTEDEPNTKIDFTSNIKIVFDNDSINEIVNESKIEISATQKCSDALGTIEGVTFTDNNVISAYNVMNGTLTYDLDAEFDASILEESTDGYIGMGEGGEIINHDVHMSVFEAVTGKLIGFKAGQMGDAIDLSDITYPLLHTHIEGFYYDRAFTEAVGENATMPSYFKDIYAKVVADEGYSVLQFNVITEVDGEEIETGYYESYTEAGNYKYEPETGFKVKEVLINGVLAENAIANGVDYELNNVYHIDIYVTQIAE